VKRLLFLLLGLLTLSGCDSGKPSEKTDAKPVVVLMETTQGNIKIELYPDKTPETVKNFLRYVDSKAYDGTVFHRVVDNFVIQGGGYELTDGELKERPTDAPIRNEATKGLSNKRGTISMARLNDPHSATNQFFISTADNVAGGNGKANLDPGGVSPAGYCAFGKVIEGMDVVDRIAGGRMERRFGMDDVPVELVTIKSVRRVEGQ